MHKNKLKLIIFIQTLVIYCLCLYFYMTRGSISSDQDGGGPHNMGIAGRQVLPGQKPASWAQTSLQSVDEYRRLAIKHELPIEYADAYGSGVGGMRRSGAGGVGGGGDRLNILMTGFECNKYRIDVLTRTLQLWQEFVPNCRVSLLSREQCEFFGSLSKSLVQRILVVAETSQHALDDLLDKEAKQSVDFYDLVIDFGHVDETEQHRYASFLSVWRKLRTGSLSAYALESVDTNSAAGQLIDVVSGMLRKQQKQQPVSATELKSVGESFLSVNCFTKSCLIVKK